MPTKNEIRNPTQRLKSKIRAGDTVMIVAGRDKGQVGIVASIDKKSWRAYVIQENDENPEQPIPLNAVIKHRKARMQGEQSARLRIPSPIHLSNLMLMDPEKNEPTRVGRRKEDGKSVRYAKKSGAVLDDKPLIEEKETKSEDG